MVRQGDYPQSMLHRRKKNVQKVNEGNDEWRSDGKEDKLMRRKPTWLYPKTNLVSFFAGLLIFVLVYINLRLGPSPINHEIFPKSPETCVITISALNNFGFVVNLYDSVMDNSPEIECFIWYLGDISEPTSAEGRKGMADISKEIDMKPKFKLVTMKEMEEKNFDHFEIEKFAFMFDLVELQTTIKPFAFQYTFQHFGAKSAIFLDNDIWVTSPLVEIEKQLKRHSAVVTPHVSAPIPEDGKKLNNKNILQTGVFNFGFVAFSNTDTAASFLRFWAEQLSLYGFTNLEKGMFYDQNWGMFIPAFFDHDDYYVIRDHRYNIAYWNMHYTGKGLHMRDGEPHIDNPATNKPEKTVFIHFSGISLLEEYNMDMISRYQNRFTLEDFPHIRDVLLAYTDRLTAHNTMHYRRLPYGYDKYSNGMKINAQERRMYAAAAFPARDITFKAGEDDSVYESTLSCFVRAIFQRDVEWMNPFCASKECLSDTSKITFLQWFVSSTLERPVDLKGALFFTSLEYNVWRSRPDLQAVFTDPTGSSYDGFKAWFNSSSPVEEGMVDSGLREIWRETWKDNIQNDSKYHKQVESSDDIGVNVYGWHAGLFSIGIVAIKMFRAAQAVNLPSNAIEATNAISKQYVSEDVLGIEFTRSCNEAVNLVVMNADCTSQFVIDFPQGLRDVKYNIGYWLWELDVFPDFWMPNLKIYDEIWCATDFIKNSIENSDGYDGTPIRVLAIPNETEEEIVEKEMEIPLSLKKNLRGSSSSKPFVFLVVFDFVSSEQRKNPGAAIRAFMSAFPLSDDPDGKKHQLIVKTHSGSSEQTANIKTIAKDDPRVIFINALLSDEENRALHNYQDCHVSLHRSEGYGMNILESMAVGIPAIATNYSGNVDFFEAMPKLENKCTFPIPYKLVELEDLYGPYTKGNHWAEADHESAVLAMRTAAEYNCKKQALGREMIKEVKNHFGPEAVGKQMKFLLNEALPRIIAKQEASKLRS